MVTLKLPLDVTVVNPLQTATLARAATNPGHALNYAYDRKVRGLRRTTGGKASPSSLWPPSP